MSVIAGIAAGCGYTPAQRQRPNPNDPSGTTTLTGGYVYSLGGEQSREEDAEYEQRAERELQERNERARAWRERDGGVGGGATDADAAPPK